MRWSRSFPSHAVAAAFVEAGVLSHEVDVSPPWDTQLNYVLKA